MYILPIASGSSGNCMYVELGEYKFLIDVGVSFSYIVNALQRESRVFEDIDAIFITHTHIDHIKGLTDYPLAFETIPIYISEKSNTSAFTQLNIKYFVSDTHFAFGDISVLAVDTSHDCQGSVGYVFETQDEKLSYFTDLGVVSEHILDSSIGASCAVIESNHDLQMLADNPHYPISLKERIRSANGHLSNESCRDYIQKLMSSGTRYFFLAHLSRENNSPERAMRCMDTLVKPSQCHINPLPAFGGEAKTINNHKTNGKPENGGLTVNSSKETPSSVDKYIISSRIIPERPAFWSEYPSELLPEIRDYLQYAGIQKLYQHQSEMFSQAISGKNIVITTSTASGKTLSFLLPVLQQVLKNPQSRAIFIYPTKALASDQYRALKPFLDFFGKGKLDAGVYDGDTPVNERSRIRNSSNIILTNPEMINTAFLPHHSKFGFNFIFSNLRFVVIDELHVYRGAFGAHLSNLFRRLNRICKYYHSSPQFFCSSATIANPVELAETITGKKFTMIDKDGSPASERRYRFVQPPIIKRNTQLRRSVSDVAGDLIPDLTIRKHNFIAFCKSRKAVEVVLRESRDHLKNDGIAGGDYSGLISGYRGGYKPEERKEIERKMVNGQLRGLVSTNALELGIDIGKIDTAVLVGYPGTRASFWQQSGRAGRTSVGSDTYLILDNLPFDQFIATDPDWLFSTKSEAAVVDPNNLFIQIAHVRAAAAELPLSLDDISVFPDLREIIPVLSRAQELRMMNGKFMWCGKEFPAGDYSLRNMDTVRYQLINSTNESAIAEMDEVQAFREIYPRAIYLHDGQTYMVSSLDTEKKVAFASPVNEDYYTVPAENVNVSIIKKQKCKDFGRTQASFGDIKVSDVVNGYKKIQFHNHQNLGYERLEAPLSKSYDTEGVWIQLPEEVTAIYSKLDQERLSKQMRDFWKSYYDATAYAIQNAAMMATMTTGEDIGTTRIIQAQLNPPENGMCIYDMFVGGLGYSEKAYDIIEIIIKNAIKLVEGCSCKDGCAVCVGDYHLDKKVVLWGLKSIFEKSEPPTDIKIVEDELPLIENKPFAFSEIEDKWTDFVDFYRETGESMADFLPSVKGVRTDGSTLVLLVDNDFYVSWIMNEESKNRIVNSISHYVEVPVGFSIRAESVQPSDGEKEAKIIRRYQDLNK